MPTTINQIEDAATGNIILRVAGSMELEDAVLLEKIALEMRLESGKNLTIDLADLNFLDSESASILNRIKREKGFTIEGMEIFLQNIVNETENRRQNTK